MELVIFVSVLIAVALASWFRGADSRIDGATWI